MNLRQRQCQSELMDQPQLDPQSHRLALAGLSRINAWSRTAREIWSAIRTLALERDLRRLDVLDLACGGGDVALALARRANDDELPITIQGWDKSATAVSYATERAAREGWKNVTFLQRDVLRDPLDERFDCVISTLFLHHLDWSEAVAFLRRMRQATRHATLVDDLLRTRLGYCLACVGTRLLSRSPIVHFDGPVSVQAAFSLDEILQLAEQAELHGACLKRHWPQRFLLSWYQG